MRIAQINFTRINNSIGGAEKVFFTMANELSDRGHQVGCFYYDSNKGQPVFPINKNVYVKNCCGSLTLKVKNIFLRIASCFIRNKKKRHAFRDFSKNAYITQNIKSFNPDIILFYWPDTVIYNLLKLDVPIIHMLHMDPSAFVKNPSFQHAFDGIKQCHSIQVLMPEHIDTLRKILPHEHIVRIGNIVPQHPHRTSLEEKKIIFVGRITQGKRPQLLLRAFALLKDRYPDWKLEIWGPSSAEPQTTEEVRKLLQELGLEKQAALCGSTTDIPSKIRQASIAVMPSAHEGFCLALAECMSMGLPAVVCRDCSTLVSLVRHEETGLICEPDPEGIACQLDRLMGDFSLRKKLGTSARADMEQFSPEKIVTAWEHLLNEALESKNCSQSR